MRHWAYFAAAVAVSPLLAPAMTVCCGLWAVTRVLETRRLEQKTREAYKQYLELREKHLARVYRPTVWERLMVED